MRKALIALGAVLALLVVAVLAGPSLVDWNAHKDRIVTEVREATGRDFSIQGDMSLSLLPVPALTAKGVRLASLDGGSEAPMVELEELRVRIALLPLLQGTVQVERVLLVEPKILLEVLPDGRANWSFVGDSLEDPNGAGSAGFDFRFDDVSIESGVLTFRDAERGREERFEDLNLRIVAESLDGPFAGKGSLRFHGVAGAFEATLGRLVEEGATPFNVVVKPANEAGRLQVSGAISSHPDTVAVHGRLKGEGENLARLIDGLSGTKNAWPAVVAQAFTLQGELSVDQRHATVSELDLELGGLRLTGDATSLTQPPYDARLALSAAQVDLDHLMESGQAGAGADGEAREDSEDGQEGETGETGADEAGNAPMTEAWELPADANGRFEFSVEALIYRGQLIRQLRLDAALSEGALQLERLTALLPGSSDVSVTGTYGAVDGEAAFEGRLEAASDNLRGLLQWAGADVSAVPADRLRRMSLTGRVSGTPQQISISDFDLRLDLSRISGGVVIAPRRRPGFGVGLALDSINLDAYLPNGSGDDSAGDPDNATATQNESGEGARPAAGLPLLDRFDANFNLRAGAVTLRGATAKDLQVDATLQQGVLEFRTARIGNLAGSEIAYFGRVDTIASGPTFDGRLELSVGEPVRLAPLLGLDAETLAKVPAVTGEGELTGSADALAIDASLSGGGGRLELTGTLAAAANPPGLDLRVVARHPSAADLAAMAGRPVPEGTDLGVVDLGLEVVGADGGFQVRELSGALGPIDLAGGFDLALAEAGPVVSALDVAIAAEYPDAGAFAELVGLTGAAGPLPRAPDGLGGFDLRARLTGGPAQARLEDLAAKVGPVGLSGTVDLLLQGLTPTLSGYDLGAAARHEDLAALATAFGWEGAPAEGLGGLDLTARIEGDANRMRIEDLAGTLGPVDLAGHVSADLGGERPLVDADLKTGDLPLEVLLGGASRPDGDGDRWSRQAFDASGLAAFDARLALQAAGMSLDGLRLEGVDLNASLSDGRLALERFTGAFHGGTLRLAGTLDLGQEIAAELAVTAIEVELGEILRARTGISGVAGPVYFDGDFATRGRSPFALVSGLEGTAEISGLLSFAGAPQGEAPSGSGDPQSANDLPGYLAERLGRDSVRLAGTLTAEAGLLQTEDGRLDGQSAFAVTLAKLDLPAWTLDGVTDIYERSAGQPLIASLAYGGPLDGLEIERLDVPTVEDGRDEPQDEAQDEPHDEVQDEVPPESEQAVKPQAVEPQAVESPSDDAPSAPETLAEPAPEPEEESVPVSAGAPETLPEAQEEPTPEAQEEQTPMVSETLDSEPAQTESAVPAGAVPESLDGPVQAEPENPVPTPQPASPAPRQPAEDDLLKDLLKFGG